MSITNYIQQTLSQWGGPSLEASADYANAVAELKLKLCEAGHYDLSLSLPVEPTKRKVSAVAQFRRILEAIQRPTAPAPLPADGLLNLEQAAAYLGYKPEGLRKIVKLKQVEYSQNGRGPIRFRREWLDLFIASNVGGPKDVERSPAKRKAAPLQLPSAAFGFDPSVIRQ